MYVRVCVCVFVRMRLCYLKAANLFYCISM